VSSQNNYVEYFDLVSVSKIPEYSPDGDPWTEGEKIPVTVTVRSEANEARYVYMFAKSNTEYWIDIEPWEEWVQAGDTIAIQKNIIVPNLDGYQILNVCILDDRTEGGGAYCSSAGKAYFEESSSNFVWWCFGTLILVGVVLVLIRKNAEEKNKTQYVFEHFDLNYKSYNLENQYEKQLIAQGYDEKSMSG